jgi:hypothetical protein
VATTIIWVSDVTIRIRLRGYRSAMTPAGSSITSVPTRLAPPTIPALAAAARRNGAVRSVSHWLVESGLRQS